MKKITLIFFCINLLLSSYYLDTWENPNSASRVLPALSWVQNGEWHFDEYHEHTVDKSQIDGHYYSDKAPFPAMLVAGIYSLMNALGIVDHSSGYHAESVFLLGSFLCASLPFTLIITLLFQRLMRKEPGIKAVLLATLPFYGSMAFVFAGSFFSHVFTAFLVIAGYLLIEKKQFLLAGLVSGLCFLSEYPLAVIFFCWFFLIIYREKNWRPAFWYALGIVPSLIVIMIYNHQITGSPFVMLYAFVEGMKPNYGISWPRPHVVWSLIFTDYRGALFYMPVLVFVLIAAVRQGWFTVRSSWISYAALPTIAYFLVFSSYHDWWGGWTFGPRQLLPILALLAFVGLERVHGQDYSKWLFYLITGWGLIAAIMGKMTLLYNLPTLVEHPFFALIVPAFMEGRFNDGNMATRWFDISPVTAGIIWILLFLIGIAGLLVITRRVSQKSEV